MGARQPGLLLPRGGCPEGLLSGWLAVAASKREEGAQWIIRW